MTVLVLLALLILFGVCYCVGHVVVHNTNLDDRDFWVEKSLVGIMFVCLFILSIVLALAIVFDVIMIYHYVWSLIK